MDRATILFILAEGVEDGEAYMLELNTPGQKSERKNGKENIL
jgi:hypothetical protein